MRRVRKTKTFRTAPIVVGVLVGFVALGALTIPPWVLPPIQSVETGPAAIEMVQFRDKDRVPPYAAVPKPLPAAASEPGERKASEVYKNVQVLGNLSEGEFTRTMLAITEWVAPKQGCAYCHNLKEGFASDSVYTKTVARQMLTMVKHVNSSWGKHVAPSGVTCYTCHRGENVPPWTWYKEKEPNGDQFIGKPRPWYLQAKTIRQFFPDVPYQMYLLKDHETANIQSLDPLVGSTGKREVAKEDTAENLYLFMMQMSNAMGVNCTFCHNSRAFFDWSQSTPYRWVAYWGINMVRDVNSTYIEPLVSVFPDVRKGPLGDPAKVNCGTCHLGNNKPLGGYNMLQHYVAALTVDGKMPVAGDKAKILSAAQPEAVTSEAPAFTTNDFVSPQLNVEAIRQSIAPSNAGANGTGSPSEGLQYRSNVQPTGDVADPTLGGTVTPVADTGNNSAPGDYPTGVEAPQGSSPSQMRPGTGILPKSAKNGKRAPSAGQPPSNPPKKELDVKIEEPLPPAVPAPIVTGSGQNGSGSMGDGQGSGAGLQESGTPSSSPAPSSSGVTTPN